VADAVIKARNHIGDGLFLTLIAAQDELKFDTHTGASPGSSSRWMIQAIVPELIHNPQHLPALVAEARQDAVCSIFDHMEACHPREAHWHLALIGVDPAHQGQGIGAGIVKLMNNRSQTPSPWGVRVAKIQRFVKAQTPI
jgi:GNAT superfamily N-acetyltransferase